MTGPASHVPATAVIPKPDNRRVKAIWHVKMGLGRVVGPAPPTIKGGETGRGALSTLPEATQTGRLRAMVGEGIEG